MEFTDTHAHIYKYKNPKEILSNSLLNLKTIYLISTSTNDIYLNLEISKLFDLPYSIGLHPSEKYNEEIEKIIEENKKDKNFIAIGECGLDYTYEIDHKTQEECFVKQLNLAIKYDKPVIIHTRESINEALRILFDYRDLKIVLHSWSGNLDQTKWVLKNFKNILFSFNGIITFKNATEKQDILKNIPLDKIILETDCPWLTPVPFRGQENKPDNVSYIYKKVSSILNVDLGELTKQIDENINGFFKS